MAHVLITGSADGLGRRAAEQLVDEGHEVVLHARSPQRAAAAREAVPGAADALVGELSTLAGMHELAAAANARGRFDAVIHNAGVGYQGGLERTPDGLARTFAVNVLASYVLSATLTRPERLVFLSSGLHRGGSPVLDDLQWAQRPWDGMQAYSDSKLLDVVLAFALARRWPQVISTSVDPGWMPTRMGGAGAPGDLDDGAATQAWLAVSDGAEARRSGTHFGLRRSVEAAPAARDEAVQDALLAACARLSGVQLPAG